MAVRKRFTTTKVTVYELTYKPFWSSDVVTSKVAATSLNHAIKLFTVVHNCKDYDIEAIKKTGEKVYIEVGVAA